MKLATAIPLGTAIGEQVFLRRRPFLLYFKPTPRCDLRCVTCNRWQGANERGDGPPLPEVKEILEKFWRGGCRVVALWGGEPMLRRDLPEILAHAKRLGFRTSICTNANHLATRAAELLPHLDVLLCSIDGCGARHDELRGVPGLFERVVRGIRMARTGFPSTVIKIWATVHRRNADQVEDLALLARELGVVIEYFPLSPIEGYNDELALTAAELARTFGRVRELKRRGLPVRNPDYALRPMQGTGRFGCNFSRISIHADDRGRVYSCEDAAGEPLRLWGDHRSVELDALYASSEFRDSCQRLRDCTRCRLPCVVELSGFLPLSITRMFFETL